MRCPPISIAWLMAAVAIVAVELVALRSAFDDQTWVNVAFILTIPMLDVLAIGLLILRRRGRAAAFLVGFELFGWLVVAAVFLDAATGSRAIDAYANAINPIFEAMDRLFGFDTNTPLFDDDSAGFWLVVVPLLLASFLPPQLLAALVGGWLLSSSDRVRLMIERRPSEAGPGVSLP